MNKPILFAQTHLSILQSQAYFIRDKLIDAHLIFESDIGKVKWLSIFAKSLNYQDWGHLKNKANDYKHCQNTVIFSEQTIEPIIDKLIAHLSRYDLDASLMRSIVLNACTENEFDNLRTYSNSIPSLPQPPESFILELGPRSVYARMLLEWLWPIERIAIKHLYSRYYSHIKSVRNGLSKGEAKVRFLDVYPKSGVQIETILLELVEQGYCSLDLDKTRVILTERGNQYIASMLTDDYDEEWQQWWSVFLAHFEQIPYKYIDSNWNKYINLYSRDIPPSDAANTFKWDSYSCDSDKKIREGINRQTGIELSEFPKLRFFLFSPRVYLSPNLTKLPLADIVFEIDGPDWAKPAKPFKVSRFWPNKSYVASFLEGESIRGWFGVIPDDIDAFNITYRWYSKSGAFKPITHDMTYILKLNPKSQVDWLYGNVPSMINQTNFSPISFDEYSFTSIYCVTHGKVMTESELSQIPRIQAGINTISENEEGIHISENRTLIASNGYNCQRLFI